MQLQEVDKIDNIICETQIETTPKPSCSGNPVPDSQQKKPPNPSCSGNTAPSKWFSSCTDC